MTTSLQEIRERRIKAETGIFWDKIAEFLPKSLERSALGDEKIYRAFFQAYIKFRPHLISSLIKERDAELVEEIKKYNCGEHKRLLALLTTTPTEGGEMK